MALRSIKVKYFPMELVNPPYLGTIRQKNASKSRQKISLKEEGLFWGQNIVSISYRIEKKDQISYRMKKNLSLKGG